MAGVRGSPFTSHTAAWFLAVPSARGPRGCGAMGERAAEDGAERAGAIGGRVAEGARASGGQGDERAGPTALAGGPLEVPASDEPVHEPGQAALRDHDAFDELGRPLP